MIWAALSFDRYLRFYCGTSNLLAKTFWRLILQALKSQLWFAAELLAQEHHRSMSVSSVHWKFAFSISSWFWVSFGWWSWRHRRRLANSSLRNREAAHVLVLAFAKTFIFDVQIAWRLILQVYAAWSIWETLVLAVGVSSRSKCGHPSYLA